MPDNLSVLLGGYREAIVKIFGDRLTRIILYGSYARGDFNQNSDMDIMIFPFFINIEKDGVAV